MRLAFRAGWSRAAERGTRGLLGVVAKVPPPIVEWTRTAGPYFGNDVMTLRLDGRRADLLLEQAGPVPRGTIRRRGSPSSPGSGCPELVKLERGTAPRAERSLVGCSSGHRPTDVPHQWRIATGGS